MIKRSSLLPLYARPKNIFVSGKGCILKDSTGTEFLDFTAGIAVNALGHNHPKVVEIISSQAQKLIHLSNLYHNEYAEGLADLMVQGIRPSDKHLQQAQVFFCNSGTEANEAALKFAKKYSRSNPNKFEVVSFGNAFHGRTLGALSATPNKKYQDPFQPLLPGFQTATFNKFEDLEKVNEKTCAVLIEPIQGEGGIHPAKPEFFAALRERCDQVGALLIADEIQCGLGRTGELYGYQNYKECPDIITMAKPLANGLPLGAVVVGGHVADIMKPGDHGTTFGGGPLATRVGQYVWSTISHPQFLQHVKEMGKLIEQKAKELEKLSPIVKQVRGKGLLMGMELRESVPTSMFVDLCREERVLVVSAGCNTIRLIPALIITRSEIEQAFKVFESVITKMERILASGKQ